MYHQRVIRHTSSLEATGTNSPSTSFLSDERAGEWHFPQFCEMVQKTGERGTRPAVSINPAAALTSCETSSRCPRPSVSEGGGVKEGVGRVECYWSQQPILPSPPGCIIQCFSHNRLRPDGARLSFSHAAGALLIRSQAAGLFSCSLPPWLLALSRRLSPPHFNLFTLGAPQPCQHHHRPGLDTSEVMYLSLSSSSCKAWQEGTSTTWEPSCQSDTRVVRPAPLAVSFKIVSGNPASTRVDGWQLSLFLSKLFYSLHFLRQ